MYHTLIFPSGNVLQNYSFAVSHQDTNTDTVKTGTLSPTQTLPCCLSPWEQSTLSLEIPFWLSVSFAAPAVCGHQIPGSSALQCRLMPETLQVEFRPWSVDWHCVLSAPCSAQFPASWGKQLSSSSVSRWKTELFCIDLAPLENPNQYNWHWVLSPRVRMEAQIEACHVHVRWR